MEGDWVESWKELSKRRRRVGEEGLKSVRGSWKVGLKNVFARLTSRRQAGRRLEFR